MQERRTTNGKQFDAHCRKRLTNLLDLHRKKAKEYASDFDRLANFRHGAALERKTPEQYLLGLAAKHEVALRDFAERQAEGKEVSMALVLEKTGDVIVYMLLLEGLFLEVCEEGE